MNILPTHRCFDDALELLEQRVKEDNRLAHSNDLLLVHGIALAPEGEHAGKRFAHAWVEENGNTVWDAGLLDGQRVYFSVERAEYYAAMRVQAVTRYTVREVWIENQRTGTYGPWRSEYAALCSSDRTVFGEPSAGPDSPADP